MVDGAGFGIWKSVYVVEVPVQSVAITQFVPHTFYAGGHSHCRRWSSCGCPLPCPPSRETPREGSAAADCYCRQWLGGHPTAILSDSNHAGKTTRDSS